MEQSAQCRFGIFKTEARVIHSKSVNQDYEIGVWLPFSYENTDRTYPILYVPDGEFVYPAVLGLMPTHMGNGAVPEMIVVGIQYHGISTWEEFNDLRYSDFLPQCDMLPEKVSRLTQYTHFYQHELFPWIEQTYRASADDRSIFGFSAGGMFALQMMLTQPGMFRRYVAASCYWSVDYLRQCLQEYAQCSTRPPVDLYLSVGSMEEEMMPGYQSVVETLQNGPFSEVRLNTEIIEGEGHSAGVIARTFLAGTKAVFKTK